MGSSGFAKTQSAGSSVFNKTFVEESKERSLMSAARDAKKAAANAPRVRPLAPAPIQPVTDPALDAIAKMGGARRSAKRDAIEAELQAEMEADMAMDSVSEEKRTM